jgi:hypothetical protein
MVAAALISLATSFKLPLSTTYVTFIVAMAAALPDKAWGRETAVYRVSGVVTVVAGWFVTAIAASMVAGVIALLLFYFEIYAVVVLLGLVSLVIYRTHIASNKEAKNQKELKERAKIKKLEEKNPVLVVLYDIGDFLNSAKNIAQKSYRGLVNIDLNELRNAKEDAKKNTAYSQIMINNLLKRLKDTPDEDEETVFAYTQALGTFQDINDRLGYLSKQNYYYLNNNHVEFNEVQSVEINMFVDKLVSMFDLSTLILQKTEFSKIEELEAESKELKLIYQQTYLSLQIELH